MEDTNIRCKLIKAYQDMQSALFKQGVTLMQRVDGEVFLVHQESDCGMSLGLKELSINQFATKYKRKRKRKE